MSQKSKFNDTEKEALAKTSDALTAWSGKPIICAVLPLENDFECAFFASIANPEEGTSEAQLVPLGGPDSELLGNSGGIPEILEAPHDCILLWGIAIVDETDRLVKVNPQGTILQQSSSLEDLLPFSVHEAVTDPYLEDEDDEEDDHLDHDHGHGHGHHHH